MTRQAHATGAADNALLREGSGEGRAIRVAIAAAHRCYVPPTNGLEQSTASARFRRFVTTMLGAIMSRLAKAAPMVCRAAMALVVMGFVAAQSVEAGTYPYKEVKDVWTRDKDTWTFYGGSEVAIALDSSGNYYVVTWDASGHSRIEKFDSAGNLQWGSRGYRDIQYARGVAVDSSGNVYVADPVDGVVQKLDSAGNFMGFIGAGQLSNPVGVAVDSLGHVYVTDTENHRIQKFDSAGNLVATLGSLGAGEGQFYYPSDVAVDSSDHVYVADTSNNRIQKFDSAGRFVTKWGSLGSGNGEFHNPVGVAVDPRGNVYVAEIPADGSIAGADNYRIQKFDSAGSFITKWGDSLSFDLPGWFAELGHGLAADSSGNVYVGRGWWITKFAPHIDVNFVDFDGDGKTDILWRHSSGTVAIWLVDGGTIKSVGVVGGVDPSWEIKGIADFDGDGKADILWQHSTTGTLVIWFMNGTAVSSVAVVADTMDTSWQIKGVSDFDRDGKADILWQHPARGAVAIWLMNGAAVSSVGVPAYTTDPVWQIAGVGDFTRRGGTDILWRNPPAGDGDPDTQMWFMDGTVVLGVDSTRSFPRAGDGWDIIRQDWKVRGIADFYGVGGDGILWWNASWTPGAGIGQVWSMYGVHGSGPYTGLVPSDWQIKGVGDFDGDGMADILWQQPASGTVALWTTNGHAVLSGVSVEVLGAIPGDWQIMNSP